MNVIQAGITVQNELIAIIISRFNDFINKNLLSSTIDTLTRLGQVQEKQIKIFQVPGSYEIPITANSIAKTNYFKAIITLGTIIKGETSHFKYITSAISSNLTKISIDYSIPIACGLLITNNIEQAIERAGLKMGNKGHEAALCALEMINLLKIINQKKYT
ncbi:6,7-dimethyl-8-ribityllumazine synthase [Buchnera aphidicola (Eriosoma lanigerum)]|jgi:6,7-dimethyl-8-ribityllumazine synthase|uniref:6,7-dimethyl-8-ribityllumazine synthase n=1 Tax=Buchnera aphidicola TaxID=9 RepID=UPI0034640CE7